MDEVKDSTLSEEIDRLHAEHRRYAQRLEDLIQKPYLSEDEQLEEVRLKKLKLHAKDLIYALEHRCRRFWRRASRELGDKQAIGGPAAQAAHRSEAVRVGSALRRSEFNRIIVGDDGS